MKKRILSLCVLILMLVVALSLIACVKSEDVTNAKYEDKLLVVDNMADMRIYLGGNNVLPNQSDVSSGYICHVNKHMGKIDIAPDKLIVGIKYAVVSSEYKGVNATVYIHRLDRRINEDMPTMPNAIKITDNIAAMELIDKDYNKLSYSFYSKDFLYVVIDNGLKQMPLNQEWAVKIERSAVLKEFISRFI